MSPTITYCELEEDGTCKKCGKKRKPIPPGVNPLSVQHVCSRNGKFVSQTKSNQPSPQPIDLSCIHRGEETRRVDCQTCSKTVKVRVFACALHGECLLSKPQDGIMSCAPGNGPLHCNDRCAREYVAPVIKPRRLRVAFVTPGMSSVGGAERWIASLIKWMPESIDACGVIVDDGGWTDDSMCEELPHRCRVVGSFHLERHGKNSKHVERFPSLLEATSALGQIDVLVVWGIQRLQLPDSFSGPIVLVSHGHGEWTTQILLKMMPHVTHFAAVSDLAALSFPEAMRSRVKVIRNGIEMDRIAPARSPADVRREIGIADEQSAVGYIGRFSEDKNPVAVAHTVGSMDNAVAVFVGSGWQEGKLSRQIRSILGDRCRILPPAEHIGDMYAALDCVMLPSKSEGFALAAAEAWAAGCPLVATPVGGVPEMEREHGELIVPISFDSPPEAMAASVGRAIKEGRENPRIERARAVAWRELSAAAMGRRWADYLLSLSRSG